MAQSNWKRLTQAKNNITASKLVKQSSLDVPAPALHDTRILIFGGSGSLGNQLIQRYGRHNEIVNVSRDAGKHWKLEHKFLAKEGWKLKNIVGDIADMERVSVILSRENPHIIIIAAALKYIERCEFNIHESLKTNCLGTKNILEAISKEKLQLSRLKTVLFVSTDKACAPQNVYGLCKSISERLTVEAAYSDPDVKYVCVRYGNVLNSNGSIIPILHAVGQNSDQLCFSLTHEDMTRFIMTLDESVSTIEHAILHGHTGDLIVPKLRNMKVRDLIEIFSEIYKKPIQLGVPRVGEKLHETLLNCWEKPNCYSNGSYYHLRASFPESHIEESKIEDPLPVVTPLPLATALPESKITDKIATSSTDYTSADMDCRMSKPDLHSYLCQLRLLDRNAIQLLDH